MARATTARIKASPLARRVAADLGVNLAALTGSGPDGRIVRADVARASTARDTANSSQVAGVAESVRTLTPAQRTIARRMVETKTTIPDFQIRTEADVSDLMALRGQLVDSGIRVSINDFIVRACALALGRHPLANARYHDDAFHLFDTINVGVAVAAADSLLVPVLERTDELSLRTISEKTRALADRARSGQITPAELSGGTFTVSNLGMFGITSFTALINPGQAAILAVGAARETLALQSGELTVRHVIDLSLSCDHRILYGATAADFLADVRRQLEQPLQLLA